MTSMSRSAGKAPGSEHDGVAGLLWWGSGGRRWEPHQASHRPCPARCWSANLVLPQVCAGAGVVSTREVAE